MLLVRPLLRANAPRVRKTHLVVFFIFIVSNCGGLLTPLGDPPLFLGFLKGVPFGWTFSLWPQWLLVNGVLLVVFNVWDQAVFAREEAERPGSQLEEVMHHEPVRVRGKRNFVFLLGIVAVIAASGRGIGTGGEPWPFGVAELLMLALAGGAWWATHDAHRTANRFTFGPIIEVAVLFAGIFVTMAPALLLLNANASALGVREPWQFFWATGALSSFLDNAPTYLTFAAAACGLDGIPVDGRYLAAFLGQGEHAAEILAAISMRRGLHGREHLHRERPELHGEGDRRGERRRDAVVLRLHGLVVRDPAPDLRAGDLAPVLTAATRNASAPAARSPSCGPRPGRPRGGASGRGATCSRPACRRSCRASRGTGWRGRAPASSCSAPPP